MEEDCMMILNDIIALAKDYHSTLMKQYISLKDSSIHDLAIETLQRFKNEIDELKESCEDLESVFFYLPNFSDFYETTKLLSPV